MILMQTGFTQYVVGVDNTDSLNKSSDSISGLRKPDPDRDDIPFIDFKPAVIWNSLNNSVSDYAYIRRNFTDQMVSVWNFPERLYPASRIYAVDMDGKHYRAAKVSEGNYVFAEQIVEGDMDLYRFRIIPQYNGWVEFTNKYPGEDSFQNNMIIEEEGNRGKREMFGYFCDTGDGVLVKVSQSTLKTFADKYLINTPEAYKMASKYFYNKSAKVRNLAVAGLMTIGIIGISSNSTTGKILFFTGIPAAILVAYLNRPSKLHWEQMVSIVEKYNAEKKAGYKSNQPTE
jgi:hypothetical protein